jgi:hypothetical protein
VTAGVLIGLVLGLVVFMVTGRSDTEQWCDRQTGDMQRWMSDDHDQVEARDSLSSLLDPRVLTRYEKECL